MPRWGASNWLNSPPTFSPVLVGNNLPFGVLRFPTANATQVPEDTIIRIGGFDPDDDLVHALTVVSLDGVMIYDGTNGEFTAGYVGHVKDIGGRRVIEFAPNIVFAYGSTHRVTAHFEDNLGNATDDAWTFTVRLNPGCYAGNNLLPLEALILSPMQRFLDLEPLRLLLLNQAIVDTGGSTANRDNLAARALYQMAYDTEISGILNPYTRRDDAAIATRLCNKRPTLAMSQVLDGIRPGLERGIESLFSQGALPREYQSNLTDYLDSMLYSYRVSAACCAVFLARAVENAAGL